VIRHLLAALLVVLTLSAGLTALVACHPPGEAVAADAVVAEAVAAIADAAIVDLVAGVQAEGEAAIYGAETPGELLVALPTVKGRWKGVWDALRAFAVIHDAWATALERGDRGDVAAVQAAWCELRALADERGVALGDFPVLICGEGE